MESLAEQFGDALSRIEVNGERARRAALAHQEVRGVLETSAQLRQWGVDTVLIGSYARRTNIHPGRDVDVFTKLTLLDTSTADPFRVYETVRDVLVAHYKHRAEPQPRSIKIQFSHAGEEDFSVDAVPAVRSNARWAIPERDSSRWASRDAGERWVETDPERLTALTVRRNESPTVNGQGAYVPTVKLMRQTRRHHRGDAKPGGLYFELLTYHAFQSGLPGNTFAELFAGALKLVAMQLAVAHERPLVDPAMDTPYQPMPDPDDVTDASEVFARLAAQAARALTVERCEAAILWREIIGRNDRGPCFPLPPGCDEQGRRIPTITANPSRGSDEARGFG